MMATQSEDSSLDHNSSFDALCSEDGLPSSNDAIGKHFDDTRSFVDELSQHKFNIISGFHYGEEVAKKTEINIQSYQKKFMEKHCSFVDTKTPEAFPICESENQPSTSKHDHKTPHAVKDICKPKLLGDNESWTPPKDRETPLPLLPWANSKEVWQTMVYKEEATSRTRNCRLFEDPTSFLPRMRAILVDWIMEVCEVYHLRRVTYYLAIDYIDRYLTIKPNIPKNQLQLIGISALFIAAKLEEVYPPKLSEFSYVCDGACTNEDILECELLLLNTLGWDVNPMTPTGWLNLYMQIHFDSKKVDKEKTNPDSTNRNFFFPQYSAYQFIRGSHLIDLFSLDPGFLLFNYSIIAAGSMYYLFGRTVALCVSGLTWNDLKDCAEYMAVFYKVLRDTHDPKLQCVLSYEGDERASCSYIAHNYDIKSTSLFENHTLQTHAMCLRLFETATLYRLRRMGLNVRKALVRRNLLKSSSEEDTSVDSKSEESFVEVESEEENEEGEAPIVMFAVEKFTPELATELEDFSIPDGLFDNDQESEFFNNKSKYSFDELLMGINDCTSKSLLPSKLNGELQDDEQ